MDALQKSLKVKPAIPERFPERRAHRLDAQGSRLGLQWYTNIVASSAGLQALEPNRRQLVQFPLACSLWLAALDSSEQQHAVATSGQPLGKANLTHVATRRRLAVAALR